MGWDHALAEPIISSVATRIYIWPLFSKKILKALGRKIGRFFVKKVITNTVLTEYVMLSQLSFNTSTGFAREA